jgi:hypothetical protein
MKTENSRSRFQRGSGVFKCVDCGRLTRDTGENEGVTRTCKICLAIWEWENVLENTDDLEEIKEAKREIKKLERLRDERQRNN